MSQLPTTADESRSLSAILLVDEVCDAFADALKAGREPRIEDYLELVPEQDRPWLRRELEVLIETPRAHGSEARTLPASELPSTKPFEASPDYTESRLPKQIGRFPIIAKINQGAMGIVYRACHPKLHDVALKTIRPRVLTRPGEKARILEEAKKVASFRHPNVIAIHDCDEEDGLPFFTMDLIEGGDLSKRISEFQFGLSHEMPGRLTTVGWSRRRRRERKEKILTVMEKVCRGVHAAHTHHIVHRDLKPGNILMDGDEPRVSDFGLAKVVKPDDATPTHRKDYAGTPAYMSPEQLRGNPAAIGPASDVWAVGVILYELFTGRKPYPGKTQDEMKEAVFKGPEPRLPRQLNGRIDRDLECIILNCLHMDCAHRYPSAAVVADRLVRCRDGEPIPERPISWLERLWRWAQRRPALAGLVALTLVAAIVLPIVFSSLSHRRQIEAATAELNRGIELCDKGEAGQGMLWMARSLEMAPPDARELRQRIKENLARTCTQISPLIAVFDEQDRVLAVAFSPDGRIILTGIANGTARLRDTATGKDVCEPFPHPAPVLAVAFSPDGKSVLTGCLDGFARVWKISSEDRVPHLFPHDDIVFAVAFSPDGQTVFSAGGDGAVHIWDIHSGERVGLLPRLEAQVQIQSLAVSRDGRTIVTGTTRFDGRSGLVRLWDVATRKPIGDPLPHLGPVWAVAFSPNDKTLVTGSEQSALLWELAKPEGPREVRFWHGDAVRTVAFSRDGQTILTGGDDKTARHWDVASGKPLGAPLHHADIVRSVALSPDSKVILTGSVDGSARLWRLSRSLERPVTYTSLWAQVVTGMEIDDNEVVRPLSVKEWLDRRPRLDELKVP